MNGRNRRLLALWIALLLMLGGAAGAAALEEDGGTAEDLTRQCKLQASFPSSLTRLTDDDLESA